MILVDEPHHSEIAIMILNLFKFRPASVTVEADLVTRTEGSDHQIC